MSEFSWKKFQFISEVQTALIANAINVAKHDEDSTQKHDYSGTGLLIDMDNAFYAAERIPSGMTAHEAACQFYGGCKGEAWPSWALR
ncbi:hypothetical protein [Pseudomonas turukhanskensis]|uniref:Uncharacterized protein n=1 Tax=Pseudomonas turukhanskensis TaxID=1806536 RepID=A0A9W6NER9_9PSED|nr:hypothetical protein [Pseudomonas turukhanskensis]GLK88062.1 hypothetical protein GCM10017655_11240 [Pseudomonas turukhanskensis]